MLYLLVVHTEELYINLLSRLHSQEATYLTTEYQVLFLHGGCHFDTKALWVTDLFTNVKFSHIRNLVPQIINTKQVYRPTPVLADNKGSTVTLMAILFSCLLSSVDSKNISDN